MARGAAVSWALLLGGAWLFVPPPAGATTGETGYTGREVIALGFKKYFQVNLFENIIMKSVDMKNLPLQAQGNVYKYSFYHILICQNSD